VWGDGVDPFSASYGGTHLGANASPVAWSAVVGSNGVDSFRVIPGRTLTGFGVYNRTGSAVGRGDRVDPFGNSFERVCMVVCCTPSSSVNISGGALPFVIGGDREGGGAEFLSDYPSDWVSV
jgi:hypothetical protein